jgi:sugar phosphate permease
MKQTPLIPIAEWQKTKICFFIIISYAAYYLVRTNFSFVAAFIAAEYHYSKTEIGLIFTLFSLVYGTGKFFSGILADNTSPKILIFIGLVGSALINSLIPLTTSYKTLLALWTFNACFQSLGWPPCAKLLTTWFDEREIGKRWGVCNSAHAIGASLVAISSVHLTTYWGWQGVMYAPASIALIIAIFVMKYVKDNPLEMEESIPRLKDSKKKLYQQERLADKYNEYIKVLQNSQIWFICLSTLFVYIVRAGFVNWIPILLLNYKGYSLLESGWQYAGFEVPGIIGGILAGTLTDKLSKEKKPFVGVLFLLGMFICLTCIKVNTNISYLFLFVLISISGFLIYGLQILSGIIVLNYIPKKYSASINGLVGTFAYLGSAIAGIGVGSVADHWGWNGVFILFLISIMICSLFYLFLIRKKDSTLCRSSSMIFSYFQQQEK